MGLATQVVSALSVSGIQFETQSGYIGTQMPDKMPGLSLMRDAHNKSLDASGESVFRN